MRKKTICILLILILSAVSMYCYFKPQPVYLDITICSKDGEIAHFILSASWYRHWGGKRTLEGDAWVDGKIYHSYLSDNWRENTRKDIIPVFLSERLQIGGMSAEYLYLYPIDERTYHISILSWEDTDSSKDYYGPAESKEECGLLLQKWADDYNSN